MDSKEIQKLIDAQERMYRKPIEKYGSRKDLVFRVGEVEFSTFLFGEITARLLSEIGGYSLNGERKIKLIKEGDFEAAIVSIGDHLSKEGFYLYEANHSLPSTKRGIITKVTPLLVKGVLYKERKYYK